MPLDTEQQQAVKAALERHLKACPICHTTRWQLNNDVTFLPIIDGKNINIGRGQPCVAAICNTCGSVQLFNVFKLGLGEKLGFKKDDPNGG